MGWKTKIIAIKVNEAYMDFYMTTKQSTQVHKNYCYGQYKNKSLVNKCIYILKSMNFIADTWELEWYRLVAVGMSDD